MSKFGDRIHMTFHQIMDLTCGKCPHCGSREINVECLPLYHLEDRRYEDITIRYKCDHCTATWSVWADFIKGKWTW